MKMAEVKKKLLNIILKTGDFKKIQIISIETCQQKKQNQKENIKEINMET